MDDPTKSPSSTPTLKGPLIPPPQTQTPTPCPRPLHMTLSRAANLANLLPTGTVLGFQALISSFSKNGSCQDIHKCFTASLISFLAFLCFLSSLTDTFRGPHGKVYYGIATFKGFYVFNGMNPEEGEADQGCSSEIGINMAKYRLTFIDYVHAFVSMVVFLVFCLVDSRVLTCYFSDSAVKLNEMLVNVPLVVGGFASFLFVIFPTARKGIGYADIHFPA